MKNDIDEVLTKIELLNSFFEKNCKNVSEAKALFKLLDDIWNNAFFFVKEDKK